MTTPPTEDWKEKIIKQMVDRFLTWRLPADFSPDAGVSYEPEFNKEYMTKQGMPPMRHKPTGTNLFTAIQAEKMVRYILDNLLEKEITAAEARGREQIIRDVFSLKMSDPFGYGNSKVEVHDLEKIAEKYGYDKEAIIKLLLPLS